MKTTLNHKVVSYPDNPEILIILVQTTSIHKVVSYPDNPGSDNNIETQKNLLS